MAVPSGPDHASVGAKLATTFPRTMKPASDEAAFYAVPNIDLVDIEHPGLIRNIDNGVATLGGAKGLEKIMHDSVQDMPIGLSLRPYDPLCKSIHSTPLPIQNVLLRINIPKRTGRKRKRGSLGDFMPTESDVSTESTFKSSPRKQNIITLIRTLHDEKNQCRIEPVGRVERVHRFRTMADFQHSGVSSPFLQKFKDDILSLDYLKLKDFKFDSSRGVTHNTDLLPPPTWSPFKIPFNYAYHQNPAVRYAVDESGRPITLNTQAAPKVLTEMISHDAPQVPAHAPIGLPPLQTLDVTLQTVIQQLNGLMVERPVWTRRAIINKIANRDYGYTLKLAFQYVGYMFRSGPWRDTVIRYGVDPRTDPAYRIYQTCVFQLASPKGSKGNRTWEDDRNIWARATKGKAKDTSSHIFDGKRVVVDGKTWQVCDITDPLLKGMLETKYLRGECELTSDGWYQNGLWAKIRVIMKAKITMIMEGKVPSDAMFARILRIPDNLNSHNKSESFFTIKEGATSEELQWAARVRNLALRQIEDEGSRASVLRDEISAGTSRVTNISLSKGSEATGGNRRHETISEPYPPPIDEDIDDEMEEFEGDLDEEEDHEDEEDVDDE